MWRSINIGLRLIIRCTMTNRVKITFISVAALFVLSLAASFFILRPSEKEIVTISRDNEILYTFDLTKTGNQTVKIEYESGGYNIVEIKDGTIRISEADCPDKICVNTGILKAGVPIVCLPHHLVIKGE